MLDLRQLPDPDSLTPLQREVAALVREGRFRYEIAGALGVTAAVIDAEIQSIYAALGVDDLLSLAFYAHHHNLRSLSKPRGTDERPL